MSGMVCFATLLKWLVPVVIVEWGSACDLELGARELTR